MIKKILTAFLFLSPFLAPGQGELVQFSGVVVSGDSLTPIPYATLMIKNTNRGTITDFYGFFSFVAIKGDTIEFSCVGYKKSSFILPDSLKNERYSLIQVMMKDTILLRETFIYPWPTREQFKKAFVELKLPDDDLQRAQHNIELAETKEAMESVPYDGSINYKFVTQQRMSQLYYAGQYPPNNLLNPIAWAQFIKAWQDGAFKRKDK